MKTLDEVIEGLSVCDDVECCYACPHSTDYNGCDVDWGYLTRDALFYLKEYKKDRENPDGDHQQLKKCRALLQDFYRNDPLSWDELKTMEGKPVWIDSVPLVRRWVIIKKFHPIGGNKNLFDMEVEDGAHFLRKNMRRDDPAWWQAYRKERE